MAVTSIWSIKGWIGKVINYAENPDKTKEQTNQELISENETGQLQGLNDVITYAVNAEKTRRGQSESMEMELAGEAEELMEQYVSGVNCAPTTAREEMIAVKKRFGKEGGIVAFHGYQSFAPGECNPAMAHEIGKKLAEKFGYEFYDQEIIKMIAGTTGMTSEFIRRKEETMTNSLLYDFVNQMYLYGKEEEAPKDKIFEAESKVIRELVAKGKCVIIGRCSDYVLRENEKTLKLFFTAPLEVRAKRIMERLNISKKEAEQVIRKEDRRRADNYRYYTGRVWGSAANVDLTFNTAMGYDTGADPDITGTSAAGILYEYLARCESDKDRTGSTGIYDSRSASESWILSVSES